MAAWPAAGGCGEKKLQCNDTSALSFEELRVRTSVKYVEASTFPDKNCLNCRYWQGPASKDACGACQLVKGPIHPLGYCASWAAPE